MKRKDLLLLTFLLSQAAPLWAMEPEKFDDSDHSLIAKKSLTKKSPYPVLQVQQIKERILKGTREIRNVPTELLHGEKVFLTGMTGAGKSTLLNFLAGRKIEVDDLGRLDTSTPVKGSEIGHDETSKTTSPSLCFGPNNMVLVDFPGLKDTGGPEIDLINAYVSNMWFTGQFKILVAVDEADLRLRTGPFLSLMNNITKAIPLEQLKEGLALVVTKQGSVKFANPHQKLKDIINGKGADDLTEDVKTLLLHLTDGDNIHIRVPFFPCPNALKCEYDSQASREKILESIRSLKPMENPKVQLQLSPGSTLLLSKLGRELNQDIEHSIKTILKPKIVKLCQEYTTAYARDNSMPGLKNSLETIISTLALLENDSAENLVKFSGSFDRLFDQEDNVVKECVKTLMFLQTLQPHITCSTKAWYHALHPTLTEVHELINSLGDKLCRKISTFLDVIHSTVLECDRILPESQDGEGDIERLTQKLQTINEAALALQSESPDERSGFIYPISSLFPQSNWKDIENAKGILEFLNTLKPIEYPIFKWLSTLQSSMKHIKTEIATHQKILDLARVKAVLEQEREEARLATQRLEGQRAELLQQVEVQREQQEVQQQQLEIQRQENEAQERQLELQRQENEAQERQLELQRQENEVQRQQIEMQEQQLAFQSTQIEMQRQQLEEEHRTQADAIERQRLETVRLAAEVDLGRQRLVELEHQQHATDQERQDQGEVNRQLARSLEVQQQAHARLMARQVQIEEEQRVNAQRQALNARQAEDARRRLVELEALRRADLAKLRIVEAALDKEKREKDTKITRLERENRLAMAELGVLRRPAHRTPVSPQVSGTQKPGVQKPIEQKPGTQKPENQKPGIQKPENQKPANLKTTEQKPRIQKSGNQKPGTPKEGRTTTTPTSDLQKKKTIPQLKQAIGKTLPLTQNKVVQKPGLQKPGTTTPMKPSQAGGVGKK